MYPYKKLYTNAYSSIINNNQKVEATEMLINLPMEKQNVVYLHDKTVIWQQK